MSDIEIKRGYEVLPDNNIRFGIKITNVSDLAISDVEVILDYMESLFKLEGNRVQKAGVIPPSNTRTIEFVLKPLGCVHKVNIEALVSYRDPKYEKHVDTMHPKEVHCVCPFLKQKTMSMGEFLELFKSGHKAEMGLNFQGVSTNKLVHFLEQTCKNRHYKIDEIDVDGGKMLYLASESIGEKAYYLLTAFIKETDDATQVLLMAVSDKPHGLNGFLNEMVESLRHVVGTVHSAREIGIIKKEQVINIIDSVVQRTSFEMGGEVGASSINIKDSVVQRTEFNAVDEEKKKREEQQRREAEERKERERKDQEKQELLRKQKEGQERQRKEKEEQERKRRQREEDGVARREKERLERKELEKQARIKREEEIRVQQSQKGSYGKFFAVALVLGIVLIGFWMFSPDGNNDTNIIDQTPVQTPDVTQTSSSAQAVTPSTNQKTITNSIGMEFVLIPAGEFNMGSTSREVGRHSDEGPVQSVTISKPFYIGKYEVTQNQWRDVLGNNPSRFNGDELPVEKVSWNDVQDFIKKLNEKEGGNKYRLPTEAEWEYAARAGTTTRYSFGDDEGKLGDYAWYDDNSGSKTHSIGQKKPNSWGLYDMHGNVWEWTQDWYHNDFKGVPTDGSAWEGNRVLRGGAWEYDAGSCRSADRGSSEPDYADSTFGFRLLRSP